MSVPTPQDQNRLVKENSVSTLQVGQTWYLVSLKWYNSWKEHVGYDTKTHSDAPGPIDNEALLETTTEDILKKNVSEMIDFVLLNEKVGNLLHSWYGGKVIKRKVIVDGTKEIVELYPYIISVAPLSSSLEFKNLQFSKKTKLMDMISFLKHIYGITQCVRLWFAFIGIPYKPLHYLEESIEIDQLITREIGQQIIIEIKQDETWPLESLKKPKNLEFETSDHKIITSKSFISHTLNGDGLGSKPGVVGLTNLGNTCFMNAALQCLTKIPQIKDYFLNHDWKQEINTENPLGMEGKLAQVFSDLIASIWSGKDSVVTPRDFKMIIGKFQQQFAGQNQQDSQEFLSYLMDGLHEDLNRIVMKPNVEPPKRGDRKDQEVAKESWDVHLKRNNSIFTDKLQGQYKSTLVCPDCENISITFDPFMSISLPFPTDKSRSITYSYYQDGNQCPPVKYKVVVDKDALISDLRTAISAQVGVSSTDLVIAEIFNSKVYRYWIDSHQVNAISHKDTIVVYQCSKLIPEIHTQPYSYKVPDFEPPFISVRIYSLAESRGSSLNVTIKGVPLNMAWNPKMTNKQLYDSCFHNLKRYVKKNIEWTFDLSEPSSLFPMDDNMEKGSYKFFFTLRYETISGSKCDTHERLRYNDNIYQLQESSYAEKRVLTMMIPDYVFAKYIDPKEFDAEVLDTSCLSQEKSVQLTDCLDLFRKTEKLNKDNTWYCNVCKKHVEPTKQLEIWKLPDVLILHLKRFNVNERYGGLLEKIEAPVDVPLEIDMKEYCEIAKHEHIETGYELIGVIDHIGSINNGHYTANVKVEDQWYLFNDTITTKIENPINSNAYVLFYINKGASRESQVKGKIYPSKDEIEKQSQKQLTEKDKQMLMESSKFK